MEINPLPSASYFGSCDSQAVLCCVLLGLLVWVQSVQWLQVTAVVGTHRCDYRGCFVDLPPHPHHTYFNSSAWAGGNLLYHVIYFLQHLLRPGLHLGAVTFFFSIGHFGKRAKSAQKKFKGNGWFGTACQEQQPGALNQGGGELTQLQNQSNFSRGGRNASGNLCPL